MSTKENKFFLNDGTYQTLESNTFPIPGRKNWNDPFP